MSEPTTFHSESARWYDMQGNPQHETLSQKGEMRKTTLADARKNGWVPSVTTILQIMDKPALDIWKLKQMMLAALTLPRAKDEPESVFVDRLIQDSQNETKLAAQRGKALHAALRCGIEGQEFDARYIPHVTKVQGVLLQLGIVIKGRCEHSFTSRDYRFGGTVDFFARARIADILLDFKTKKQIDLAKRLAYDEHRMQLAAYAVGVFGRLNHLRAINIFVGVDDCQVLPFEWPLNDLLTGWEMFKAAQRLWTLLHDHALVNPQTPLP